MSEGALTDVDGLINRVREASLARPTVGSPRSATDGSALGDHVDALKLARRRCDEALDDLGRAESGQPWLSRLVGNRRAHAARVAEALLALRDLIDRLITSYRHDIEYLLEHLAELERRSLVADDVARRVDLLEHAPNGAVVDLAHFAAWFAPIDLVLWLGDTDGAMYRAVASAGPIMVSGAPAPRAERAVGAAVVIGMPDAGLIDQVIEIITIGGLLVVIPETGADLPAAVDLVARAGFDSAGLTWLADELHGVIGSPVATFRRDRPR